MGTMLFDHARPVALEWHHHHQARSSALGPYDHHLRLTVERHVDLSGYRHLGSWVDIYNRWPWRHPTLAIRKLHHRGVRTLFLQTSNYGADFDLFRPRSTRHFLNAAHKRGMNVVGWYVPSFRRPGKDLRRLSAAITYRSRDGERFDSVAMDIEATLVGNVWRRNHALLDLSKRIRSLVGPGYPLGAITPDPVSSLYWPRFPYQRIARLYDVLVPMGYFSFRADGYIGVKHYTSRGIRTVRREVGSRVAIHMIGGIGGDTRAPEAKGFVRAVEGHNVLGGSYYDFSATTDREWKELRVLARPARSPNAVEPSSTPTSEPARHLRAKRIRGRDGRSGS